MTIERLSSISIVLGVMLLVAAPFAALFHYGPIRFVHKRGGPKAAIAMFVLEALLIYSATDHYLAGVTERINSGVSDGPVGFFDGMIGGFFLSISVFVVALNAIGVWRTVIRPQLMEKRHRLSTQPEKSNFKRLND